MASRDLDTANWGVVVDELRSFKKQLEFITASQQKLEERLLSNGIGNVYQQPIHNGMPEADMYKPAVVPVVDGRYVSNDMEDPYNDSLHDVKKNHRASFVDTFENHEENFNDSLVEIQKKRRGSVFHSNSDNSDSRDDAPKSMVSGEFHEQLQKKELRDIMEFVRQERQTSRQVTQEMESRFGKHFPCLGTVIKAAQMSGHFAEKAELVLDSIIGVIIFSNALFVGASMDLSPQGTRDVIPVEVCYGILFWGEMLLKLWIHGCKERYCGPEAASNTFDLALVLTDTAQLCIVLFAPEIKEDMGSSGVSASLFRVVRLMRLARVIRLLRSNIFKDLLTMFQGLIGGARTLGWSFLLFMMFIYVVALIFREVLGPKTHDFNDEDAVDWYFRSVPRSMMTVFRCSFGDCSDRGGTPIFEHVTQKHGKLIALLFGGFIFITMIGLFNVISAIFVESTLKAAADLAEKKENERLLSKGHFSRHFLMLLECLLEERWGPEDEDLLSLREGRCTKKALDRILGLEYERDQFQELVEGSVAAQKALDELDIGKQDWRHLSDILDPDNSGTIAIFELLDGLQRLRGSPRRSDIIAVDLMLRSVQQKIDIMWEMQTRQRQLSMQAQVPANGHTRVCNYI